MFSFSATEQFFRCGNATELRVEATGREVSSSRSDAVLCQSIEQFCHDRLAPSDERGHKAAPKTALLRTQLEQIPRATLRLVPSAAIRKPKNRIDSKLAHGKSVEKVNRRAASLRK